MPPPKAKLHKNTGKLKTIPKHSGTPPRPAPASSSNGPATASDAAGPSEADRQFELELYWCIQQLENSLNAPHIRDNSKKVEDTLKLINTLKSPNQPLIKKRQIMRTSFGDYRAKMAEEERTMALAAGSVGFDAPKKKAKYHFVKKAAVLSGERDFRFNFANIQLEDDGGSGAGAKSEENGAKEVTERVVVPGCGVIEPSDNTFRFNFSVEN
ncbi:hypothetical protein quinque_008187 [Culex quinquefasciatus]|uniref:UPF0488 protein CG14286 n=1 Tax=Culex pipiens TaxID=7175 RepID=A0A8D8AEB7_CULPI